MLDPDHQHSPSSATQPAHEPRHIRWYLLAGFIVVPALLTLLCVMAKLQSVAVGLPFVGGAGSAVAGGFMFGRRFGKTPGKKALIGIVSALGFGFLSFTLAFVGCVVGGFQLDLK